MSNFWLDMLRVPHENIDQFNHKEFNRYLERAIFENKTYDSIVKELLLAEGSAALNPQTGFYRRDNRTNVMDTLNATVRAFLGTRIGCAQCHNHRFDKWTQKDFYESAAFMWGIKQQNFFNPLNETIVRAHGKHIEKRNVRTPSQFQILCPTLTSNDYIYTFKV